MLYFEFIYTFCRFVIVCLRYEHILFLFVGIYVSKFRNVYFCFFILFILFLFLRYAVIVTAAAAADDGDGDDYVSW